MRVIKLMGPAGSKHHAPTDFIEDIFSTQFMLVDDLKKVVNLLSTIKKSQ